MEFCSRVALFAVHSRHLIGPSFSEELDESHSRVDLKVDGGFQQLAPYYYPAKILVSMIKHLDVRHTQSVLGPPLILLCRT